MSSSDEPLRRPLEGNRLEFEPGSAKPGQIFRAFPDSVTLLADAMMRNPLEARPVEATESERISVDAYAPADIARRVAQSGVAKARTNTVTLMVLAVLAGAFVSLGALLYTVVTTGTDAGFGVVRLLGGLSFCLGLVLVVIAGAELFTGNNLLAMAWASRLIDTRDVLRNWLLVYLGNVIGCVGTVLFVALANTAELGGGAVGETAIRVARAKIELSPLEAFARGLLCNALVCLAVWLAMGGRSVADKILAVLFPITAFVALGFEHSIANWFFLPYAWLIDQQATLGLGGAVSNLLAVTAGNICGGTLLVALVYWTAYLRHPTESQEGSP